MQERDKLERQLMKAVEEDGATTYGSPTREELLRLQSQLEEKQARHMAMMNKVLAERKMLYRLDPASDRAMDLGLVRGLIARFKPLSGLHPGDHLSAGNEGSPAHEARGGGKRAAAAIEPEGRHDSTSLEHQQASALDKKRAGRKREHGEPGDANPPVKKPKLTDHRQSEARANAGKERPSKITKTAYPPRPDKASADNYFAERALDIISNPLTFDDFVYDAPRHGTPTEYPSHSYFMHGALPVPSTTTTTRTDMRHAHQENPSMHMSSIAGRSESSRAVGPDKETVKGQEVAGKDIDTDNSGTVSTGEPVTARHSGNPAGGKNLKDKENGSQLSKSDDSRATREPPQTDNSGARSHHAAADSSNSTPAVRDPVPTAHQTPKRKEDLGRQKKTPASEGHKISTKPVFQNYSSTKGTCTNSKNPRSPALTSPRRAFPRSDQPRDQQGSTHLPMFTATPYGPASGSSPAAKPARPAPKQPKPAVPFVPSRTTSPAQEELGRPSPPAGAA